MPPEIESALALLAHLAGIRASRVSGQDAPHEIAWQERPGRVEAPEGDAAETHDWTGQARSLAEARYKALVEQIPAVTFLASLDGTPNDLYVSPQIEELLGFTQEQWLGDPILWFRQLHAGDREVLTSQFASACMSGRPVRSVIRVFTRAGELVWIHIEARFVRDEQDRPLFLQGVGFDVTEQYRAQETREQLRQERAARAEADRERRRLEEMFTHLPAAIALLRGPELVIEYMNPVALEVIRSGQEAIGKPAREVFPDIYERARPMLEEAYATGSPRVEKEWTLTSWRWSGERFFNVAFQPLRDREGGVSAILVHAVDVTPQVAARRQMEEALQIREEFISVAAHELRNPVNSLSLGVRGLRMAVEGGGSLASISSHDILRRVDSQVERLARLVERLLDVSRITAGRCQLEFELVDLVELTREVVARSARESGTALLALRPGPAAVGWWDRLRLDQILTNLLSNAIKYSEGKPIEVAVERDGDSARLWVRDEGPGLSPDDQARIFQKFERASPSRHHGGLGLGLWITRGLVEAHGGTIAVESAPGRGAKFTVELPLDSRGTEERGT